MIFIAIVCTLIGGVLGASLEPLSFSVSIPIAIMGGFILKAIKDQSILISRKTARCQHGQTI